MREAHALAGHAIEVGRLDNLLPKATDFAVTQIVGEKKHLWAPFPIGIRITEPALLAVKATRYPGQELRWDGENYRFTNHDKANQTIVKRDYRAGFEPPKIGLNA